MSADHVISRILGLDFETANPKRGSACALGLCLVDAASGDVLDKRLFLIDPKAKFAPFNVRLHHIDAARVAGAPTFSDILPEIASRLDDQTVVAMHNAEFDIDVLDESCVRADVPAPEMYYFCTMLLSRAVLPSLQHHGLTDVSQYLSLPQFEHHSADDDAATCALILQRFCNALDVPTVEALTEASGVSVGRIHFNRIYPCESRTATHAAPAKRPAHSPTRSTSAALTVHVDFPDEPNPCGPLFSKLVVFTGEIDGLPREYAQKAVVSRGGFIRNKVTHNTDYLVHGTYDTALFGENYQSGKLRDAQRLSESGAKVQIISADQFLRLLDGWHT